MRLRHIFTITIMAICIWVATGFQSHATIIDPLTTIELDTPVYFLAPDGSPLITESQTFTVEAAEEWIRLIPDERHDALLIEAQHGTHELQLSNVLALSVPGETKEDRNLHHILLLLPDGQSLEATGTYSGIRPRGLLRNAFKTIKKHTHQVYKNTKSKTKKVVSKTKGTANKAKKLAQQSAKNGWAQGQKGTLMGRKAALYAKQQVERGAKVSALKVTMKVMQQSIEKTNQDKRYLLKKIRVANRKQQQIVQKLKDKNLPKQTKERLQHELKTLLNANKQSNVEIQNLASRITQSEQALSEAKKKLHDASQAIIN